MQRIARFEKVSLPRFQADFPGPCGEAGAAYEAVVLPRRATRGSAGYDFFLPVPLTLAPGEGALIATGVRALIDPGWTLVLAPRSGLGFKYRLQLDNTVGVIDSDYALSDNEGHILARVFNDGRAGKTLSLPAGSAFMQGLLLPFGITEDDEAMAVRNGGFGSTDAPCADAPDDALRDLTDAVQALLEGERHPLVNLANAAALLYETLRDVNWCGFYLMDGGELVLGPFCGKPACRRIALTRGVCGAAASQGRTLVVADVHAFPGHIACDAASRSELVVPLFHEGRVIGVLDVDSPRPARFGGLEQDALERVARALENACDWTRAGYHLH